MTDNWMIYGVTGYTGRLILEEAVNRGHQPILAGRNREITRALARTYGLEYEAFAIPDSAAATRGLQRAGVDLVLHCAGPFVRTVDPMLPACLHAGVHYLDITGEIPVFERVFAVDQQARDRGIVLMPGVGFDIAPTDCLGKYVADQLPGAASLDVVISSKGSVRQGGFSAGTAKSILEMLPNHGYIRRGGQLMPYGFGRGGGRFPFPGGERTALVIPWGDVFTAYYTTGVPNITTYLTLPPEQIAAIRAFGYPAHLLAKIGPLRRLIASWLDANMRGPGIRARQLSSAQIYVRATDREGQSAEAWLETAEPYLFTARAAVRSVERVLEGEFTGAQTPAGAFGADFVMEIADTSRYDTLAEFENPAPPPAADEPE